MKIWTIGFTKTSAERFFSELHASGAHRLVDVRLHNVSQLAGFAKRDDLAYFLQTICNMGYEHMPHLSPTAGMLDDYRKRRMPWSDFEQQFVELMRERRIEVTVPRNALAGSVLLCSENTPDRCHRRLVVEYLAEHWDDIEIHHL